ncbi:MAG: hypothetical protein Q7T36_15835 [Fluviicoccus sp.]|uniref:hypothetical protein n=1 Tax=Fluviicoccus sp. TaxID=2003552 RepID=UPI002727021C|nr:hypothetical protein [Fluviicoccus sp.]MDO8331936.1 hypothetical protein [Fluviicoccus sp.]
MPDQNPEVKLLAHALYQMRILLSGHLGSMCKSPIEVRVAAHMAYALHNEALEIIEGRHFDVGSALKKIEAIDNILGTEDGTRFSRFVSTGKA